MQTIHFKVAAQNSIRRFVIVNPTYTAVRRLVASLFGINVDDSWVLQYKDEEKQLITFSSDEELKFACQLNEKLLHLQVVLNDAEVHFLEKEDKKDKEEKKERARKSRSFACLSKKQARLRDRISCLATDSARAKSQVEKLEKKLADVTAELEQLSRAETSNSNISATSPDINPTTVLPTESAAVVPVPAPTTPLQTAELSVFNKQLLKEVSSRFFGLRREIHQERMRILSLSKVLKALQTLSRHGSRTDCGVQVNTEEVDRTKASLVVAKEEFSVKKTELRNQAQILRALERQQRQFLSFKKKEKKHRRGRNSDKSDKPKHTWRGRNSDKSDKPKRTWRKDIQVLSDDVNEMADSNDINVWKEKRDKKRALRRDMKDRKEKRDKRRNSDNSGSSENTSSENSDDSVKEQRKWHKHMKEECDNKSHKRAMRRRRDDAACSEKLDL